MMQTQLDHLNYLQELGFTVDYWTRPISSIDEVIQICQDPATLVEFNKQDIEFDGIVIKVMELNACTLL
jgi:NAD-dependent DNA ligase